MADNKNHGSKFDNTKNDSNKSHGKKDDDKSVLETIKDNPGTTAAVAGTVAAVVGAAAAATGMADDDDKMRSTAARADKTKIPVGRAADDTETRRT